MRVNKVSNPTYNQTIEVHLLTGGSFDEMTTDWVK